MNCQSASERELIERTRGGERDLYGKLVRRHQTGVYNIAYRLVGEPQIALDLAQETFLRAFQSLDTFDLARPFAPWIHRIATNIALNWLERKHVPAVPLERDDESELPMPDFTTEPERNYLRAEESARVRRAILELSPRQRVVIELRHFQDLAYAEIAATLNVPVSDIKSDLFRARQKLRQVLSDE